MRANLPGLAVYTRPRGLPHEAIRWQPVSPNPETPLKEPKKERREKEKYRAGAKPCLMRGAPLVPNDWRGGAEREYIPTPHMLDPALR